MRNTSSVRESGRNKWRRDTDIAGITVAAVGSRAAGNVRLREMDTVNIYNKECPHLSIGKTILQHDELHSAVSKSQGWSFCL